MILGVGIDLVNIVRIQKIYKRYEGNFMEKILSSEEIEESAGLDRKTQINYLAKRFAAKEALVKAIGTGFDGNFSMSSISIKNDTKGKPYYIVSANLDDYIKKLFKINEYSLHLSISDDRGYATAIAIIEKVVQ